MTEPTRTGDATAPVDNGNLLQLGAVVQCVCLSLRTVRHYEAAGLISPAARTVGGFRLYDDTTVARLLLIMQMKPLGFTLEEMLMVIETREQLANPDVDSETRETLRARIALFSASAEEKVRQLRDQVAAAEDFAARL